MPSLRWVVGRALDMRVWRPATARYLFEKAVGRLDKRHLGTDREHVEAAAAWLCRAQDVTAGGGFAGRYRLDLGWSSEYPETTGYIVPTLIQLSEELRDPQFMDRASKAITFLLSVQLESGAFPGREVADNLTHPSVFNTAQVLAGLDAWDRCVDAPDVRAAADRAASWLVSVQDPDGAWRRHVYRGVATTYTAHASCWLADFGARLGQRRYLEAAAHHADWVMRHRHGETGWFDLAGFGPAEHHAGIATTHTIAYTLWGLLRSGLALEREDLVDAVRSSARPPSQVLLEGGWLPGMFDNRWLPAANYSCLTGNAQMALVWLHFGETEKDPLWYEAANLALDLVKRAQALRSRDPGIEGAIPGSDPIWGEYMYNAFPNWAPKFFIDGLLARRSMHLRSVSESLPVLGR